MNPKDFIEQLKDYADIADASYALLHYINENEDIDYFLDELKSKNPNESVKPPARWVYADGIKLGYEITKENTQDKEIQKLIEKNKRKLGQPTAYALAIEARFLKDSTLPPTSLNFTPPITATTKLTLTGHSLGGCLAQLFCICNKKYSKTQRIAI